MFGKTEQWNRIVSSDIRPVYTDTKGDATVDFQMLVLGQLYMYLEKNNYDPLPHTVYNNQL